jgi:hypothetical protein
MGQLPEADSLSEGRRRHRSGDQGSLGRSDNTFLYCRGPGGLNFDLIHPLTGPIEVEGTGDAVEVEFLEFKDMDWTVVTPGFGFLAQDSYTNPYGLERTGAKDVIAHFPLDVIEEREVREELRALDKVVG